VLASGLTNVVGRGMLKSRVMTKLTGYFSQIGRIIKKKNFKKFFLKKQKQAKIKAKALLTWRKKHLGRLKKLPHNYRNIAAKLVRPIVLTIFWLIFITSLLLPTNQAEKIRKDFLAQPNNPTNRIKMTQILIAHGYFGAAKKELEAIGHPDFLSQEKKALWQKNYLTWGKNSPKGREILINNWQKFLKEYPDYKIGWIYLSHFQLKQGKQEETQKSFQKAKSIDPGLEKEIGKLFQNQL
jgi:tetratricopeptide (TPR) repeat protein